MAKIRDVKLETVCGITSRLPVNDRIEVAINYYHVNAGTPDSDTRLAEPFAPDAYLVDLPGYGFANVSVSEKAKWGKMIENYLRTSKMLQTVFLLVDIRHKPSANDKMMYDWIVENGMDPVIVATKKDKLKKSQIQKALKVIREGLDVRKGTKVVAFSAETKEGREEIWTIIGSFLPEPELTEEQNGDILWELSRP